MIIYVAKRAGFCYGVSRAVQMALDIAKKMQSTIYTLGPIIHNTHVVNALQKENIVPCSLESLTPNDTVVIRSHGTGPHVYEELNKIGCTVIDATCP